MMPRLPYVWDARRAPLSARREPYRSRLRRSSAAGVELQRLLREGPRRGQYRGGQEGADALLAGNSSLVAMAGNSARFALDAVRAAWGALPRLFGGTRGLPNEAAADALLQERQRFQKQLQDVQESIAQQTRISEDLARQLEETSAQLADRIEEAVDLRAQLQTLETQLRASEERRRTEALEASRRFRQTSDALLACQSDSDAQLQQAEELRRQLRDAQQQQQQRSARSGATARINDTAEVAERVPDTRQQQQALVELRRALDVARRENDALRERCEGAQAEDQQMGARCSQLEAARRQLLRERDQALERVEDAERRGREEREAAEGRARDAGERLAVAERRLADAVERQAREREQVAREIFDILVQQGLLSRRPVAEQERFQSGQEALAQLAGAGEEDEEREEEPAP